MIIPNYMCKVKILRLKIGGESFNIPRSSPEVMAIKSKVISGMFYRPHLAKVLCEGSLVLSNKTCMKLKWYKTPEVDVL